MAEHVNSYFYTGDKGNRFGQLNGTDITSAGSHSATLKVGPSGSVTFGAHTFWNVNEYEFWLQVGWPDLSWTGWMDITPGWQGVTKFTVVEGRGQTFTVNNLPAGTPVRVVVKRIHGHRGNGFLGVTLATDSPPPAPPAPTPPYLT